MPVAKPRPAASAPARCPAPPAASKRPAPPPGSPPAAREASAGTYSGARTAPTMSRVSHELVAGERVGHRRAARQAGQQAVPGHAAQCRARPRGGSAAQAANSASSAACASTPALAAAHVGRRDAVEHAAPHRLRELALVVERGARAVGGADQVDALGTERLAHRVEILHRQRRRVEPRPAASFTCGRRAGARGIRPGAAAAAGIGRLGGGCTAGSSSNRAAPSGRCRAGRRRRCRGGCSGARIPASAKARARSRSGRPAGEQNTGSGSLRRASAGTTR